MKDKRGFTLIELLAVIVILAVIALIATPIIMNVINDAKKGAAKDSMYSYVKAVELASAKDLKPDTDLLTGTYTTKGGDLYTGSTKVLGIDMKGTKPEDNYGSVTLVKGRVTTAELKFDGNIITYDGDKASDSSGGSTPTPTSSPTPLVGYRYEWGDNGLNYSYAIETISEYKNRVSITATQSQNINLYGKDLNVIGDFKAGTRYIITFTLFDNANIAWRNGISNESEVDYTVSGNGGTVFTITPKKDIDKIIFSIDCQGSTSQNAPVKFLEITTEIYN